MGQIDDLEPGSELTNAELSETFKVGNMGGMRRSLKTGSLVIVSDPFKGLYIDRWIDGVFHYTGTGKIGDQSLSHSQNKTLSESQKNGVAVHLFEVHKPGIYTYVDQVELAAKPYQDTQDGADGKSRKVWIFPVAPMSGGTKPISIESLKIEEELQAKRAHALSDEALEAKAAQTGSSKVGLRSAVTQQYQRNPWVAEYAKRRAAGHCELCNEPAPFSKRSGEPYLEVHHVEWLSQGGADTIENTVALCPNCHRRMHVRQEPRDAKTLRQKIAGKTTHQG